jgi:hypothetical protein
MSFKQKIYALVDFWIHVMWHNQNASYQITTNKLKFTYLVESSKCCCICHNTWQFKNYYLKQITYKWKIQCNLMVQEQ